VEAPIPPTIFRSVPTSRSAASPSRSQFITLWYETGFCLSHNTAGIFTSWRLVHLYGRREIESSATLPGSSPHWLTFTPSLTHPRINHSNLFADHKNHIKGIENFWNLAKRPVYRFNSVTKTHFYLF
jgi:hypothetical protein